MDRPPIDPFRPGAFDGRPDTELLESRQSVESEEFAADLGAREAVLLEEQDAPSAPGEERGRRRAGRTRSHDDGVERVGTGPAHECEIRSRKGKTRSTRAPGIARLTNACASSRV